MKFFYTKNNSIVLTLVMLLLLNVCKANVTVTPASNGSCLNIAPGSYTTLSNMTIAEGVNSDFAVQTNTTLILTAPAGFQFNAGSGSVSFTAGRNITAASVTVTAATITVTLSVVGTNKIDNLQIANIGVIGTIPNASGQILRLAAGGSAIVAGDASAGGVNHGSLTASAGAAIYTTAASGNWSSPATWVGGIVPGCNANIIILHSVTADISLGVNNLTIATGGDLITTNPVTVIGAFAITGTGTYTHNNASNVSSTIFNGTENFSTTSNLIINNWYSGNAPVGTFVSGDFGNVTMNVNYTQWKQSGQFSTNRIKGTLTVTQGQVVMDETNTQDSLVLQDVVLSGTGTLMVQKGTTNSKFTFITNNFTDNSTSNGLSAIKYQCHDSLIWNCNGNLTIGHTFSAIRGTGGNANSLIHVTGDMNVTANASLDLSYSVIGSVNLTVDGNTTVSCATGYFNHFARLGTQSVNFTTTDLVLNGSSTNNYLQSSTGNVTVTILNDFKSIGTDGFRFTNQSTSTANAVINIGHDFIVSSGTISLGYSSQNINCIVANDFAVSGAGTMVYGQLYNLANSGITLTVNGNFNQSGGTFTQTSGTEDMVLNVNGVLNIDAGSFFGTSHVAAGNWGIATFNINAIDFDGGTMYLFDGRVTDGRTVTLNVTGDFDVNFTNPTDRIELVRGITSNNALLDLNIGGNFNIAGNTTAYFTSSASSGDETVDIAGNMNVSGGTSYFVSGTTGNAHNIYTTITGNLSVSNGTLRLSNFTGLADITVGGNLTISGGTTSIKWDSGAGIMNVNGNYQQTAGTFNFHSRNLDNTNQVLMSVYGDFTHTGGTLNFDSRAGNNNLTNTLVLFSPNYTIGGTGIITHANHLTANTVFGSILFNRSGNTLFNRTSATHDIQQVKQTVSSECHLILNSSINNLEIASHISSVAADNTTLTIDGILEMGLKEIYARAQNNYYAQVSLGVSSRLITQHPGGLYSGSATTSCINSMISGKNRMNYSLDPTSTVEYNGTDNQLITGIPNGIATGTQHKYGILDINFNGTPDAEFVYPETSNEVYIRTTLILTQGELNLDNDHNPSNAGGRSITLENNSTTFRTSGYVRSEVEDGSGIIKWNITNPGTNVFPFGYSSTEYIPFTFEPTSGSSGDVSAATYHTNVANTPFPAGITHVRDVTGADNSANTVDRFWSLIVTGNPVADLTFIATPAEVGTIVTPQAQRWVPSYTGWESAQGIQSNPDSYSTLATGISGMGVWWTLARGGRPLPVDLITFKVACENGKLLVNWTTASEVNNDYFTLERSRDNVNFEPVNITDGAGSVSVSNNYSYADVSVLQGTVYYRLKQTDFNGQSKYSSVISATSCNDIKPFSIINTQYTTHDLQITIESNVTQLVGIHVTSADGKICKSISVSLSNGINKIHTPVNLTSGLYFISAFSEKSNSTTNRKLYINGN